MQITLHGNLAETYGKVHHIKANSIREALVALSTQLKMFDGIMLDKRPPLRVVGYNDEKSLEQNPEEIDIIIAIIGGGAFGKIVVGALLIVAGALIPGAQFLIGTGIGLVLGGVSQLFIKAPSLSGENDLEASNYLGVGNNTTELGTLRSYSMGTMKIDGAHVIAVNIDSSDLVRGEFPA